MQKDLHQYLIKGKPQLPHSRQKFLIVWFDSRLESGMYEKVTPIYANPVLPFLAIALADNAFKDYRSYKEIFSILPLENGMLHKLEFKKEMLKVPFF
jgi:hypothetical protein